MLELDIEISNNLYKRFSLNDEDDALEQFLYLKSLRSVRPVFDDKIAGTA